MVMAHEFQPDEEFALGLDAEDALAAFRARFHLPRGRDGGPAIYFNGNSLGLQPTDATEWVNRELEDWGRLAVDAHFEGRTPWYSYHEVFRESAARLVGARPGEAVMMNGLTVNLHLMMVSFYRPTAERYKILIEDSAFPSDVYAVKSQLRYHGHDPSDALLVARGGGGRSAIEAGEWDEILERHGGEIALVLVGGVNYYTGQAFDMQRITARAHEQGCVVGFDLAHAAGNLVLRLHEWQVDFAVWCSYKYLNGGPGAVAGCFVHERHHDRVDLPRFAGWWGNDPQARFERHGEPEFEPLQSADGWQLSNPPIFAMAPLRASMEIFDEAGMGPLRSKSMRLTAYLGYWIDRAGPERIEVLTPREPESRGCQISMRARVRPRELFDSLRAAGVFADFREPDVVRVAPVPLYNSFHEVWRLGRALAAWGETR